jgi:cytochrome-b5 reductase
MVAGGTGITPFYQLLQAADKNGDKTEFYLMFGNKSTKDILLKKELEELVMKETFSFKLYLVIDSHETDWTGGVGFITKEMITNFFPGPAEDTLLLTCGPPIMTQKHLLPIFTEIGYKKEEIFDF